jgi:predicted CopG family antitoxin
MKTITVKDETWQRLRELGTTGDTLDSIINKCIESYVRERAVKQ